MRAGQLRHRILLQISSESKNALGEATKGWNDGQTVWGSVSPMSGRELFAAQQFYATVSHKIVMRAQRVKLSPKDRVVYNGRIFNLEKVFDIDERGMEINAWATELVS